MILTGIKVVWGLQPNREIRGAPVGRQRLQLRRQEPAKLNTREFDSTLRKYLAVTKLDLTDRLNAPVNRKS
ncbi:MAG: hypothetical protein PHQ12_12870 [Chthoniobacteraceae bacterium]|nr:hypothetical protein [Chthoniobacteraceae bacterium]